MRRSRIQSGIRPKDLKYSDGVRSNNPEGMASKSIPTLNLHLLLMRIDFDLAQDITGY